MIPGPDDDFFTLPPTADEHDPPEPRYRSKPWRGPPPATIPAVLPVERVLARTDDVAVTVTAFEVYPAGLTFEVLFFLRPAAEHRTADAFDPMQFHHHHRSAGETTDDVLRLGVQFADGRKATNLEHAFSWDEPTGDAIVLQPQGGGGGGDQYQQSFWLWPVPPAGPLTLVCQWPARGIPLTRTDVDGDALRAAAARAQVVFSEDHLAEEPDRDDDGPGWSAYVT